MNDRLRHGAALAAWTAFLVAALVGLHELGDGPLAVPPLGATGRWLGRRDAATALFALVRIALAGAGWYLLVSTVVATVLRLGRADALAGAVEACAPAPLRRLVRAAVGASLAASVLATPAAAASDGGEPVAMRRLPDAETGVAEGPGALVTMTRLDETPAAPEPAPRPPSTWTVRAGDSLWAIAERTLAEAWLQPPTDDEVDPYWRRLVEQNRQRLPDPANPDLIHPDLEVHLPETPERPVP